MGIFSAFGVCGPGLGARLRDRARRSVESGVEPPARAVALAGVSGRRSAVADTLAWATRRGHQEVIDLLRIVCAELPAR
jgi:hypothetical protein